MMSDGVRAVDISADFRLKDISEYRDWYEVDHPYPELVEEAVYGLPELGREDIAGAKLVANPGCYPTAAILAIAPAVSAGAHRIRCDRGREIGRVGHRPQGLGRLPLLGGKREPESLLDGRSQAHAGDRPGDAAAPTPSAEPRVTFIPHLVPMTRGILTTCYAPLKSGVSVDRPDAVVREAYESFYADAPFRPRDGSPAGDQAHIGQQRLPRVPDGRRQDGTARSGELHRQPGERCGRPGRAEYEPDVRHG